MHTLLAEQRVPPVNPANGDVQSYYKWNFFSMGQEMPDVYNVIDSILIPTLFNTSDSGLGAPSAKRRLRGQLVLLGALRLRAKHVRPNSCDGPAEAYGFGVPTDLCYAGTINSRTENRGVLQYRNPLGVIEGQSHLYSDKGCNGSFSVYYGLIQRYSCGGFIVEVPFTDTYQVAQQKTKSLREDRFCYAASVRFFEARFFAYHISTKALVSVHLAVETTSTGGFYQDTVMTPFVLARFQTQIMVTAVVVLLFVLFFSIKYAQAWRYDYARSNNLLNYPLQLWNLLDLVNYLVFIVFFIFYVMWVEASGDFLAVYPDMSAMPATYSTELEDIQHMYVISVKINAFNFLLIFLKILKFLRLNDRINILTRTLNRAARTLFTIIVVFSIVVLAYALAANTIYGRTMFQFRNINNAWSALFRLLIGDFDYEAMRNTNQTLTFVFFWSFVVLGLFILLNMIVAVIMDSFEEEVKSMESFSTSLYRLIMSTVGWLHSRQLNPQSFHVKDVLGSYSPSSRNPAAQVLEARKRWVQEEQVRSGLQAAHGRPIEQQQQHQQQQRQHASSSPSRRCVEPIPRDAQAHAFLHHLVCSLADEPGASYLSRLCPPSIFTAVAAAAVPRRSPGPQRRSPAPHTARDVVQHGRDARAAGLQRRRRPTQ